MSKVLIIGCGGVASVAIHKCCQVPEVFTEICIASRTKSKCDKLAAELAPKTATKITTAQVDADKVEEVIALIKAYQPDLVMNIALPYQDLTIMDACLACGVNYMDTALSLIPIFNLSPEAYAMALEVMVWFNIVSLFIWPSSFTMPNILRAAGDARFTMTVSLSLIHIYQPVGCTATIVTQMYDENGVEIEPKIAGLLLAAILSDTLVFRSPTCTPIEDVYKRQAAT